MFPRRTKAPGIRVLRPKDETRVAGELLRNPEDNVYLLGLLTDYSLANLSRMGWGIFYVFEEAGEFRTLFYVDVTGLLVTGGTPVREAFEAFASYCGKKGISVSRVISIESHAEPMGRALENEGGEWEKVWQTFSERGMLLREVAPDLPGEEGVRLAELSEAREIAEGSARAMEEELNVVTAGEGLERLVHSKRDLIERGRYYLLKEEGTIRFQAYLSASLPEVSQVQGVWTPPEFRGRGLATRCMTSMCREVLRSTSRMVLRVQERNLPAIRVYEKIGFERFQEYQSIWYETEKKRGAV